MQDEPSDEEVKESEEDEEESVSEDDESPDIKDQTRCFAKCSPSDPKGTSVSYHDSKAEEAGGRQESCQGSSQGSCSRGNGKCKTKATGKAKGEASKAEKPSAKVGKSKTCKGERILTNLMLKRLLQQSLARPARLR